MKGQLMRTAAALLLVLGVSVAYAAPQKATKSSQPSKAQAQTYVGTVDVSKDKAGDVTAVKLTVGTKLKHSFNVTLDKKGKELAEKMAGKQVHAKALTEKKNGTKWLTVEEYSAVTATKQTTPTSEGTPKPGTTKTTSTPAKTTSTPAKR